MVRTTLRTIPLLLLLLTVAASQAADIPARPNIVVILCDDMGFSDIGCYGSEIPTPNLDKLVVGGLRFTQFYNTGRCCPTRASLLTGLYSHQAGVGHMTEDQGTDGYRGDLNDRCVTIAEVLRSAGYRTAMTGKWHVTKFEQPRDEAKKSNWPLQRGFDHYFGIIQGCADYFRPNPLTLQNEIVQPSEGFYTTDAFVERATEFVDQGDKTKPFFLYLAFNAPHFPLMAPAAEIAKFRGKYKVGWDVLRQQRYARQIDLGIIDKAWPLSPRPPAVKAWDSVLPDQQDRFDHIMAIYAATVAHIDTAVGRLVDALRQRGELDNTLLFFLSDNGANAESGPNGRLEGKPPGAAGSEVFEGQSWATLSNTPFRRYKHFNHEGGIATPLIVHWPAGIKACGELRSQPGHLIDLMATCVDVAGATYPTEFKGHAIQAMEGKSLLPAFADRTIERDALYWEHEGNRAIRVGKWKLVAVHPAGKWELYDMERDRTELHDLAAAKPELVKAMTAQWERWAQRTHAIPWPWRPPYGKRSESVVDSETTLSPPHGDRLSRAKTPQVNAPWAAESPRPNFVIILIDDMGYGDIGPFGSKLNRTPHLDRMAREGMKLTSFYAAPVCTPSRAQMMTGCYAKRVSLPNVLGPVCSIGISAKERTIADLLKQQGYATMAVGKWHLGDQPVFLPTRHGFDHYFGLPYSNDMGGTGKGAGGHSQPLLPLLRDGAVIEAPADQDTLTSRYTQEAVQFIKSNQDRPFFLYLPHTAVHVPLHPGAAFKGKSANGTYGDWVEEVDWSVGRVLDTLRELKLAGQTFVLFTSDNGPWLTQGKNGGTAGPLHGGKGTTWEGGMREPTIAWWPGQIAAGTACDAPMSEIDVLPTLLKLAGGEVPTDRKIDGKDVWPLLAGQTRESPHDALFYFNGNQLQAVRSGPWKLAITPQGTGLPKDMAEPVKHTGPRLYNLDRDIGEKKDVAAQRPEVVDRLLKLIEHMGADLGSAGIGPGVRPPDRIETPQPLLKRIVAEYD